MLLGLAALCAGLAATLAATARQRTLPDPEVEARPDGCGRDYLAQTRRDIPNWVFVGDRHAPATGPTPPPRRLEGLVASRYDPELAVHPTPEDLPTIHRGYDFNFNVLPDPAYRGLLAGSASQRTGNFAGHDSSTGRVHVEREQPSLPSFAWPEAGDRIAMVGSWVWDCGHWTGGGERTEIHTYRALWVERNRGRASPLSPTGEAEGDLFLSSDKTFAGVEADCAHRTKGVILAFRLCLTTEPSWQDLSGTYRFRLRVPHRPGPRSRLRVRVLDAGSSAGATRARASVRGNGADVTLTVKAKPGQRLAIAQRVLARWSGAPTPVHLRVRFLSLLVRRGMDPAARAAAIRAARSRPPTASRSRSLPANGTSTSTRPGPGRPGAAACCGPATARSSATGRRSTSASRRAGRGVYSCSRASATSARSAMPTEPPTRCRLARARRSSAPSTATTCPGSRSRTSPRRPRRSACTGCDRRGAAPRARP